MLFISFSTTAEDIISENPDEIKQASEDQALYDTAADTEQETEKEKSDRARLLPEGSYTETGPGSVSRNGSGEEEAPESIFSTQLGDSDVDFYMKGTWDIFMAGSIGYNMSDGEFISTPIESMDPGFQFSQIPDLTMSLWLMDRYFFEATIKEDSEQNTFLLGYQGKEDEFVQSVLIGNTRIDIDDYSFLSVSEIPDRSIGASAAFKTDASYHEVMLRYDPSQASVKEFRGSNEITREIFPPYEYERGILFILPDIDITEPSVYIESENGKYSGSDGRLYKKGDSEDFIISESEGTLRMREPAEGRILVYYTKNGYSVGHSSLGTGALCGVTSGYPDPAAAAVDFDFGMGLYLEQDMSEKEITIDGKGALLVYNKNEYSPFESYAIYKSSASLPEEMWKTRFGISDKSSDEEDIDKELDFTLYADYSYIQLYVNSNGARDLHNRYPLSGENLKSSPYGPGKAAEEGSYRKELRMEVQTPVSSFYLDPDVIPGSVNIKINGFTETRYDIDYSTGLVTFNTYIHPNDVIKISYRSMYADSQGGDLLFASGNRFLMGDFMTGELGFGIRWNVLENQYSVKPDQYPGALLATGGLDYQRETTKIKFDAGISLTSPDTTGILRLFDMQKEGIELNLAQTSIFPSSVPEETLGTVTPDENDRGTLIYKDYTSSSFGSSSLNNYTWSPPSDQIYEYKTGNPPGPYAAKAENDGIRDEVMVMEYDIPASKSWAGAQVPVIKSGDSQDLTDAEAITFKIKSQNIVENFTGDTKLFLQIGAISEDLDNDNTLDRESSVYSDGFPFNDSSNNAVLLIGGGGNNTQGNSYLDTEDNDLNEILDKEDDNNVVTVDILTESSLTSLDDFSSWKLVRHVFTAAQKKMLSNSSYVRFSVTNDTGFDASGKLIIGEVYIESSPFKATAGDDDATYAREIFERNSAYYPSETLVDAYAEVEDIFFQDLVPENEQKVLEVQWKGGSSENLEVTGYSTPVPYDMYRDLNLYIRIPQFSGGGTNITISLTDTGGKGITCSFDAFEFSEWRKLTIDLDKEKAELDGYNIDAAVSVTSTDNDLSMLKITSDAEEGTLYIDEIHYSDPDVNISTGTAMSAEHTFTGDIWRIGDASLIHDLTLSEDFSYIQEDFAGDLSENTDTNNTRTKTGIRTGILNSTLETNFDFRWIEPEFFKTIDHTYTTPFGTDFFEFQDMYSETDDEGEISFSKSNYLKAEVPESFSAGISTSSTMIYKSLTQNWEADFQTESYSDHSYGTSLSLTMNSDNYTDPDSGYAADWIESYKTLIPSDNDSYPDRSIKYSSTYTYSGEERGFKTEIETGTLSSGEGSQRSQTSTGSVEMQFPFYNLSLDNTWQITPSYKREFSYTHNSVQKDGFTEDQMLWFSDFGKQSYFYTGIPFAEFFLESTEDKFVDDSDYLESSIYTPSFELALSRSFGSQVSDLYIPSEVVFDFEKEFKKEEDSYLNTYTWGAEMTARAVNLFGGFGSNPLFDFYKTDEFITRAGFQIQSTDTLEPEDREVSLSNNLYFTGYKNNELALENRLTINYVKEDDRNYIYDDATVSYTWIIQPKNKIYFKYLAEEDDPDAYFMHTESAVYTTAPETVYNDRNYWSVLAKHESALIFPEKGNLRALFAVGIEKHRIDYTDSSDNLYLMGIQAGIYGKVSF